MVRRRYIPDRGDIVWVDLNPTKGREQRGKRPAVVVSPRLYNSKTGLALVCPITSRVKDYPFEVRIGVIRNKSVALTDQLKSIDWEERKVKYVSSVGSKIFLEIQEKILKLIA